MMPKKEAVWASYARMYALYQVLRFLSPPQPRGWIMFQAPFVAMAGVRGERRWLCAACVANVTTLLWHAPFLVDMDWWSMLTDVAVLCSGGDVYWTQRVVSSQLAIFYGACGFWKLSSDFLDPRFSCGTLFLVQQAYGWCRSLPDWVYRFVGLCAPAVTVVAEGGAGLALAFDKFTKHGILLALALHLGIMAAFMPLSIADFSALAASRLFWANPFEISNFLSTTDAGKMMTVVIMPAVIVTAIVCGVHESTDRLPANLCFSLLAAIHLKAMLTTEQKKQEVPNLGLLRKGFSWTVFLASFLTVGYAFGAPILGLMDVGSCHMFANLRLHSGSNHFCPTGLLQRFFVNADPRRGFFGDYAGGTVRVDFSTSMYANRAYPGEVSRLDPRGARDVVKRAGHVGHIFKMNRLQATGSPCCRGLPVRDDSGKSHQGWTHDQNYANENFTRYTLPALELRSLLHAIPDQNFFFVYTRLQGLPPKDALNANEWRRDCGHQVFLHRNTSSTTCRLRDTCQENSPEIDLLHDIFHNNKDLALQPCSHDTELALLPPPRWAHKFLLSNPYAILNDRHYDPRYCGSSG